MAWLTPCGHTGKTQHTDTLFDLLDLVGNTRTAKQQTLCTVFYCLLGVKHERVNNRWIIRFKIRHGQLCLIGA